MQSDIINEPTLHFLKYNNSITKTKKITKDMLKSNNELFITFDLIDLPNDKIIAIYWKFHNTNIEDAAFSLNTNYNKSLLKELNYYSLIKSYHYLGKMLNDDVNDKNNYIFMDSFSLHPTSILKENDSFLKKDVSLSLLIKKDDDFIINDNSYIEYVIQYKLNIDNLPDDLKILEISLSELERPFRNLPIGLEKIKIKYFVDMNLINKFFPKIPFGCKIVNKLDEEIIID